MPKVTFRFEGGGEQVIFAALGENLLELAKKANVAVDAPCSGNGSCGKCRIRLVSGRLDSRRTLHLTDEEYADKWRLSCVSRVAEDATVLVPDISSAYRSRMQVADLSSGRELALFESLHNELLAAGISRERAVSVLPLTLDAPALTDTMPDNERLCRAARRALGIERAALPVSVLRKLPGTLRENGFCVDCVIRLEPGSAQILDVCAPGTARPCGVAADIGTTSVSGVLVDLTNGTILAKASAGNGQIRYGADVIHRILEQGKPGGADRLQTAILCETLLPMLRQMYRAAGIDAMQVYGLCFAGNSTMEHLLLGVDAGPLRTEPYIPAFFAVEPFPGTALGLPVNESALIRLAPNIGSYVGGDITAGALVSLIWNRPELSLFIDLGTNGELVLGNEEFLLSCACSAGPAFEGGDISCGMRATDGAIEAVSIDSETLAPGLTVIGGAEQKPVGLCGSGIIDCIAELFRVGLISAKGKFTGESARILPDESGDVCYVLADAAQSATGRAVTITEVDIDNFIRAKGAIFSAIMTMLSSLDMDVSMLERVYVAGGIGSGVNVKNAIRIGMLPDLPAERYQYLGNSSLTGAYAMLLYPDASHRAAQLAQSITYLELSAEPHYMDEFVAACFLPHTNASLFSMQNGDTL